MTSKAESTPPPAASRARSVLSDLLVMVCTGTSIGFFAHITLSNKEAGTISLTPLYFCTAIAVLVGTLVLQLTQKFMTRRSRKAASGHRIKHMAAHNRAGGETVRRGKPQSGAPRRSENVRFSGRS
jgi:hypothetical protein